MRKIVIFAVLLCLCCTLWVSAGAATAAKSVSAYATVSNDGSAQVTLTVNIHLDQTAENLQFALPEKASNVTVNGARARTRMEGGLRQVDISRVIGRAVGDFTLIFTYSLPNMVVTNEADQLELQIPLLAGFAYPVQALEISVTLPGPVTAKPAFSSGYHQANIEKDIYCTVNGATITAVSQMELKDHETLSMSLLVTEEMFPQTRIAPPNLATVNTLSTVFMALCLLYWALALRNLPAWPSVRPTPPEGYTAGEFGSILHLKGANLNMMVFSWAQLGYLQMYLPPDGNVRLYRQMTMGNERSAYEQRCFNKLFGRSDTVDAGSLRYGSLYQSIEKAKPNVAALMHTRSGNLYVFRGLAAAAGVMSGVSVALGLSTGAALQWLLVILLGGAALISSWYIQGWAGNLLSCDRRPVWISLGLCGGWLLLSLLAGSFSTGAGMVLGQLFAGLLAALGGRRTPAGRQMMGEILGLRRYLKTVSREQLALLQQNNPDYFHQMMPYAIALGVDAAFAKRFGGQPVGACPYILSKADGAMHAGQWCNLMRRTLKGMHTKGPNTGLERLVNFLQGFMR